MVSEADAEVFFYFRFFEAPPALLCRRANVALQNMCRHTYSRMKGQEKKHENSQVIQLSVDTDVLFCTRTAHSDAKPFILVDSIYFDIYGNYARSEFGGALTVS